MENIQYYYYQELEISKRNQNPKSDVMYCKSNISSKFTFKFS